VRSLAVLPMWPTASKTRPNVTNLTSKVRGVSGGIFCDLTSVFRTIGAQCSDGFLLPLPHGMLAGVFGGQEPEGT
jgi:hypothetical protein